MSSQSKPTRRHRSAHGVHKANRKQNYGPRQRELDQRPKVESDQDRQRDLPEDDGSTWTEE